MRTVTISDQVKEKLLHRELELAFKEWFELVGTLMIHWSACAAPEELAEVAMAVLRKAKEKGLL